jgi:hypothetical protein
MSVQPITRRRMLVEMAGKYVAIAVVFGGIYSPYSIGAISRIPLQLQESLISFMGFLMAAAIIGAFELSYLRTNLDDKAQRYLAHWTKFTLYSSILLLTQIGVIAILITDPELTSVMVMASAPIMLALVIYDYWDAARALDMMGRL